MSLALARVPAAEQRAVCTEDGILCRKRHLRNGFSGTRVLFPRAGAFVVFSVRRVRAYDEQIVTRRKRLMASASGQDRHITCAQLEHPALIAAKAHLGAAAGH